MPSILQKSNIQQGQKNGKKNVFFENSLYQVFAAYFSNVLHCNVVSVECHRLQTAMESCSTNANSSNFEVVMIVIFVFDRKCLIGLINCIE